MYQTEADVREERTRRWLYLLLGASMLIAVGVCGVILFFTLAPTPGARLVGNDRDFVVGEVRERAVKRLQVTELLPAAPNWSEDIIFVVKQTDKSYRAYLGLDPMTGCKINWREPLDRFIDSNCSQVEYTIHGRNQSQAASLAGEPPHMIELEVDVRDGDVYVVDHIVRRDIR